MLVNLLLLIAVAQQFSQLKSFASKVFLIVLFCCAIILAQLYVYPQRFANGWDSTIIYTRYFNLRDKMRDYIIAQQIDQKEVATGFPLNAAYEFTNLNNSTIEYANKYFGGINNYKYIIESNINNDFRVQDLEELQQYWVLEKEFAAYPIYIRLYRHISQ